MRLLVSVADPSEARAALEGGADVIDAKQPRRGALAPVRPDVLAAIRQVVGAARPGRGCCSTPRSRTRPCSPWNPRSAWARGSPRHTRLACSEVSPGASGARTSRPPGRSEPICWACEAPPAWAGGLDQSPPLAWRRYGRLLTRRDDPSPPSLDRKSVV